MSEKLALKTELTFQRRMVETNLNNCSIVEERVYKQWLQHIDKLIDICVERNRF